jgi:isoquinoline 1-oxidoreductase beta subunit
VVKKIWVAVAGGLIVNPPVARQQIQSAVMFGLSATLKQGITVSGHRIREASFGENEPLRMDEAPDVEVQFFRTADDVPGMGEVGVPAVAPAVCNAIFAAIGTRVRKLPLQGP